MNNLLLHIGPYQVYAVPTGIFGLDGGAMFGTVPKVLWEKSLPADAFNRIRMQARVLLLRSEDRRILVDTGNGGDFVYKHGDKFGSKFAKMFNIQQDQLLEQLALLGIEANDITDVIHTHLHFDHCGGSTQYDALTQRIVPRFPKATYHVQKQNWENALAPNVRERASYLAPNFMPLWENGQLNLLQDTNQDIAPCIELISSNGHTVGQQLVKVSDQNTTLLYCGDLIPTSHHVRLAWIMGYDISPLTLMEEKNHWLSQAAKNNWHLFFEHDPDCDLAQVISDGGDFQVSQRSILKST